MATGPYSIQELADLGDVSRRTVRYYVQEGLIPPPNGVGRGRHYDQTHLDRLLEVKAMQASGRSLDEIRAPASRRPAHMEASAPDPLHASAWRRLTLAPGLELHVASGVRFPDPARLRELAEWWRGSLKGRVEDEVNHVNEESGAAHHGVDDKGGTGST